MIKSGSPPTSVLKSAVNSEFNSGLLEFTHGIDVDCKLAAQEIQVQCAWAQALVTPKILSQSEANSIVEVLKQAGALMEAGSFEWRIQDEDVHMNLERFVTEKLGDLGKKMHLGRSRNDLIATTLRLYVRDQLIHRCSETRQLVLALCEQAQALIDVIVPGTTHLQHGQPVRFGHIFAAHGWAFARDCDRMMSAAKRTMRYLPLGSAALSGTTVAVDLKTVGQELGFSEGPVNSYDAVGDRDFVIEALDAMASVGVHLSRLSEDLIYWTSPAVALIRLPREWSTGSSIMPNKRNPDVPELVRGKSAHLIASAGEAHVLVKGLPTSYANDLHEIKQILVRSDTQLANCLKILPSIIREMACDRDSAARLCKLGQILATEVADHLAGQGIPFRDAYARVATLVECAESKSVQIEDLPLTEWSRLIPELSEDFVQNLSVKQAVERRCYSGGTARAQVIGGIERLKKSVDEYCGIG